MSIGRKSRRWTVGASRKQFKVITTGTGQLEKPWPFNRRHTGHGRRERR